ncbi:hypothetical protein A1O3_08975 [Capronia epimyces CBS 606.96]|uniref:Crotonobetaine/carnitine-CoA ligase n=1 Tax=Capronia epimyces CBS 606.96 TaxID=1182542 RepID=W9XLG3_9EURO|nr:uncharacterized protein A1O3_08975 [Capronia epimyces CBS 606.96]EXJ77816.1 hypothetical protein A1O3_08975 [Capronia epimyces CBS 606.96]
MGSLQPPRAVEPPILVSHPSTNIVKITLNRPRSLNALNVALLNGLVDALATAHAEGRRIIVLEGAGDRSFCAGEDLKETLAPRTGGTDELRQSFARLQDITRLTSSSEALVIAAVHGFAIGGGAELALAADFVIGGPNLKFKFPEVPIGHAATGGITLRLTYMVGLLKAKELLLRGRFVEAEEALKIGLLTEAVDDPKARALELASQLEKLPAISARSSKASLERSVFTNMEAALADEVNVATWCFSQSDAAKAFENFAKRSQRAKGPGAGADTGRMAEADSKDQHRSNGQLALPVMEAGPHAAGLDQQSQDYLASVRDIKDINVALEHATKKFGHRTFVRTGRKDYSFTQVDESVGKLAGGLASLGIGPGDRVLVMMRNSIQMVEIWLATNRLGATWVPINVELRSVTLEHVVQSAAAKVAIVDAEFLAVLKSTQLDDDEPLPVYVKGGDSQAPNHLATLYTLGEAVKSARPVKPSDTAAFLYTSGTTGKSKPCSLSHQYFILQAMALVETFGLRGDDVLYCPFPLFHADATALTTIPAILLGATAALSARYSASRFWSEIRETQATVYDFMGATLALTYKQKPSPEDRNHRVRLAWGVPIPAFAPDYEARFGHPLYTLYGSVEASLPIMQQGPRVPGSCGTLRRGYQMRIVDPDDNEVAPNTPGQLLLRSDIPNAFFQGYFGNLPATVDAFRNLWLHTGDLAKVDEHGNVYFVGRAKDLIRRRGENVNAAEVEEEFLRHPDVVLAAAFAIPSELGAGAEEDVKVAIKLRDESTLDEAAMFDWSVRHMARFQVPSVIELVPELKKTPTGKVERIWLKAQGGKRFDIRQWQQALK